MKILNIETATGICSVALGQAGKVIAVKETHENFQHAKQTTIFIEQALADTNIKIADIDAVAVSAGPGSYTGLRIGASVAKGICYALNKPLIAVPTLASLAWASRENEPDALYYAPMIDARRMEVYVEIYDNDLKTITAAQPKILTKESFLPLLEKGKVVFSGDGSPKFKNICTHPNAIFVDNLCSASNLVALSHEYFQANRFEDIAYFSPFYLKKPNITTPKKRL